MIKSTPSDTLKALLQKTTSELVVISIGSAGNDLQQICPTFVLDAARSTTVTIINLDPQFAKPQEKDNTLSKPNLDVIKLNYNIQPSAVENLGLNLILSNIVTDPKRKLIILNHMSPEFQAWMVALILMNIDKLGHNFEFIGSYFQDIPIVRYHPNLFKENSLEAINQIVVNLWSKWRNAFDQSLREHQYNTMTTAQLLELRKQVAPFGTLYRNLATTPYQDLFKTNMTPSPIQGLSEAEHKRYIERLTARLNPKAPLVDAAEKNILPVVIELVQQGTDINSTNDHKRTPLMQACAKGNLGVIEWLLKNGANASLNASNGETALDFTIYNDQLQAAELLIQHHPEVLAGDIGAKAKMLAQNMSNPKMIALIEKHLKPTPSAPKI